MPWGGLASVAGAWSDQPLVSVQQRFSLHYRIVYPFPLLQGMGQGGAVPSSWLPHQQPGCFQARDCEESAVGCVGLLVWRWVCSELRSPCAMELGSRFYSCIQHIVFALFLLPRNEGGAGGADV